MKTSTALSVVDAGIGLPSAEEAVDSSRIKEHQVGPIQSVKYTIRVQHAIVHCFHKTVVELQN